MDDYTFICDCDPNGFDEFLAAESAGTLDDGYIDKDEDKKVKRSKKNEKIGLLANKFLKENHTGKRGGQWRGFKKNEVAALSLQVDGTYQLILESAQKAAEEGGFGVVNESDPRYIAHRAKYGGMTLEIDTGKRHKIDETVFAQVAVGDSLSIEEREEMFEKCAAIAEDEALPTPFRNFLKRLAGGDVKKNDVKRWMPVIIEMRSRGVFA